ncbi:hypothetical protein HPB47_004045 [Ixodes persulcatus]|uniref:Uncharacterized protein n=1 Tax=Ixodes persulcatus TaxID=34615 RepID=A0AC60PHR2_IXOPE|nr:hypothetical protein HPB47_004045 [Ixodes persulcatus]
MLNYDNVKQRRFENVEQQNLSFGTVKFNVNVRSERRNPTFENGKPRWFVNVDQYADTHPFMLIGDFNVNVMKSHWIVEYMSSHHSLQHVSYDDRKQQPTTIHGTCIDHVFTNFKIHPLHQDPLTVHFSDHKAILIKAKCTPQVLDAAQ